MVDLDKRTETAGNTMISLIKGAQEKGIDIDDLVAECIQVVDNSQSMEWEKRRYFTRGVVQAVVERALAACLAGLDDDGRVPVLFFDSVLHPEEVLTKDNYEGFVSRWFDPRRMRGTQYLPVINKIVEDVRQEVQEAEGHVIPKLVLFVTDGEPGDSEDAIKRALFNAADLPIFWQFIGLGYKPEFLEELDNMPGRVIDNVGLTVVHSVENMDDETWFREALTEYIEKWLPGARKLGLVA